MENNSIDNLKLWINDFIIKLNICPFAKPSFRNHEILYRVNQAQEMEDQIAEVVFMMNDLIENDKISNAFLLFEKEYQQFDDFLEFFYTTEAIIEEMNYHQDFQIVSFHPEYQFDGIEKSDPANQRNQSPFPLIHILRIKEVTKAIVGNNTKKIVDRNIKFLRERDTEI